MTRRTLRSLGALGWPKPCALAICVSACTPRVSGPSSRRQRVHVSHHSLESESGASSSPTGSLELDQAPAAWEAGSWSEGKFGGGLNITQAETPSTPRHEGRDLSALRRRVE